MEDSFQDEAALAAQARKAREDEEAERLREAMLIPGDDSDPWRAGMKEVLSKISLDGLRRGAQRMAEVESWEELVTGRRPKGKDRQRDLDPEKGSVSYQANYHTAREEGLAKGRIEGAQRFVLRQGEYRFGSPKGCGEIGAGSDAVDAPRTTRTAAARGEELGRTPRRVRPPDAGLLHASTALHNFLQRREVRFR